MAVESVCVECGKPSESKKLYRRFEGGAIRLLFCKHCDNVIDKYLEYDPVIICLDILLHKAQAYRHLLINRRPKIEWHLCVLYLLSDTYLKWSGGTYRVSSSSNSTKDHSVLELEFYHILSQSCFEFLLFFCGVLIGIQVLSSFCHQQTRLSAFDYREVIAALLLSSFGKLLFIPVVLWSGHSSQFCIWLINLFVFTSNAEAIKVVLDLDFTQSSLVVAPGLCASTLFQQDTFVNFKMQLI